jgi:hypothetical protein
MIICTTHKLYINIDIISLLSILLYSKRLYLSTRKLRMNTNSTISYLLFIKLSSIKLYKIPLEVSDSTSFLALIGVIFIN